MRSPTDDFLAVDPAGLGVSPESVARCFGGNRYRATGRTRERIAAGIREALALAAPVAIFGLHAVHRAETPGRIRLKSGPTLDLPSCGETDGAGWLAAGVATLGPALEAHCRTLSARGEIYRATLLDAAGTTLLTSLAAACGERLESLARSRGLHAGRRLAPGTGGLPLSRQQALFSLADAERIGVRLSADLVMEPVKSISFFSLFRTAPDAAMGPSKCAGCGMSGCGFREFPGAPQAPADAALA